MQSENPSTYGQSTIYLSTYCTFHVFLKKSEKVKLCRFNYLIWANTSSHDKILPSSYWTLNNVTFPQTLPRMLTLKIKALSPALHVYVPVSDSRALRILRVLAVSADLIVTLSHAWSSTPSMYHWTGASACDTSHARTSWSCSTTLLKRSSSGLFTKVTGCTVE